MTTKSGILRILFLIAAVSAAIVLALLFRTPRHPRERPPNIVLVVMDTVRRDVIARPEEDELAPTAVRRFMKKGVVFNRAISPSNWTLPSHASMFTGLYPSEHGVHLYPDRPLKKTPYLGKSMPTLAGKLDALGYDTAAVVANPVLQNGYGLDRGFAYYGPELDDPDPTGGLSASTINNLIFQWFALRRTEEFPFFLFVNYFDPHEPYNPDLRAFSPGMSERLAAAKELLDSRYDEKHGLKKKVVQKRQPLAGDESEALGLLYRAEVKAVDSAIGRLVRFMRGEKLLGNTVVIVVSDHGEHLGEHLLLGHRASLYNQLIHVPLVIYSPGLLKKSGEIDCPVSTVEIFDTIMGVANSKNTEGLMAYVDKPCGGPVLSESFRDRSFTRRLKRPDLFVSQKSLQDGEWKYIWRDSGGGEFFDLRDDAGESGPVTGSVPSDMKKWRQRLGKWLGRHPIPEKSPEGIDETLYKKKRIKGIPYI